VGREPKARIPLPLLLSARFDSEAERYFIAQNKDFPVGFSIQLLKFHSGRVFSQIRSAIARRNSFLIADLSSPCANILFELGLAIGLHRPGLPICRKGQLSAVPELIADLIYGEYDLQAPLGEHFSIPLLNAWDEYHRHRGKKEFSHFLRGVVEPAVSEDRYILVIDHGRYGDEVEFRERVERAVRDRKSDIKVLYLWMENSLDPRIIGLGADHDRLVAVFQVMESAYLIVARVEDVEEGAPEAEQFVAIGMAMGIEIRRRRRNVMVLAARRAGNLDIPTDLKGANYVDFDDRSMHRITEAIREGLARR